MKFNAEIFQHNLNQFHKLFIVIIPYKHNAFIYSTVDDVINTFIGDALFSWDDMLFN